MTLWWTLWLVSSLGFTAAGPIVLDADPLEGVRSAAMLDIAGAEAGAGPASRPRSSRSWSAVD